MAPSNCASRNALSSSIASFRHSGPLYVSVACDRTWHRRPRICRSPPRNCSLVQILRIARTRREFRGDAHHFADSPLAASRIEDLRAQITCASSSPTLRVEPGRSCFRILFADTNLPMSWSRAQTNPLDFGVCHPHRSAIIAAIRVDFLRVALCVDLGIDRESQRVTVSSTGLRQFLHTPLPEPRRFLYSVRSPRAIPELAAGAWLDRLQTPRDPARIAAWVSHRDTLR